MIPKRRPRYVVEEVELADEDILDARPVTTSGIYAAVRPPPLPVRRSQLAPPTPPVCGHADEPVLMRLVADSIVDGIETQMNDVTFALARLSVGASMPVVCGAVEWNELAPEAAWVVSVITAGFSVEAILETSPLPEEATLALLAQLVSSRVITVPR